MPVLQRDSQPQRIRLAAQPVDVIATAEVLVVGGDPAALGAAIGASQAGAAVILVEHYGFVGGNVAAGLMMPLMSFHTQHRTATPPTGLLVPRDQGRGEPVVAGVLPTVIARMAQEGGAIPPSFETGYLTPFDADVFKAVAFDLLDEAGVRYLLHAQFLDVCWKAPLKTVIFNTKSGLIGIQAQVVVDCSGDGDVAAKAGAPFEIGRPSDGLTQPMSLMFLVGGFDPEGFRRYIEAHPDQWRGVSGLRDLVRQATARGELHLQVEEMLLFMTPHEHEVVVDSTRVTHARGTDVVELSYAERENYRQMQEIMRFLKKYVPGFAQGYIAESGASPQIRETRRILGEYVLTAEDILQARKFDDVIARSTYPIDLHHPDGPGTTLRHLPEGESYDIPLRCLLPRAPEQLLVAGRCLSGTHEAESSYRICVTCVATGQAAGACAALAVKNRLLPRHVPYRDVQRELLRQGANLRDIAGT